MMQNSSVCNCRNFVIGAHMITCIPHDIIPLDLHVFLTITRWRFLNITTLFIENFCSLFKSQQDRSVFHKNGQDAYKEISLLSDDIE